MAQGSVVSKCRSWVALVHDSAFAILNVYSQLLPPPLWQVADSVRHPISLSCHQLYIVIEAKLYAWLSEPEAVRD